MFLNSYRAGTGAFNKIVMAGSMGFIIALTMCGCGQEKEKVSTMTIDQEGKISYVIYESFDREYYSVDELSGMAEDEIAEYNSEYISEKITLEGTELVEREKGPMVKMVMTYDSYQDFSNFNQESLFFGTIKEAREQGYNVSTSLVDSKGDRFPDSFLEDHEDQHIVITNDRANIITPYNIEYMSNGAKLKGKKEADVSAITADTVQLLLSK